MGPLKDQVFDDVVRVSRPLGVEVVRELTCGAPSEVTVQVRGTPDSCETCEVVLYSGGFSVENDELGEDLDGRLIRLLSNHPYRIIDHRRGHGFGNAYTVGRRAGNRE